MPQNPNFPLEPQTLLPFLSSSISSFLSRHLLDPSLRLLHKTSCSDRLSAASSSSPSPTPYSDQAVLANLDWGIDALEDALSSSNPDTKLALLNHSDRMLQISAMLDPLQSTAGIPNSYLSAWSHLHLACLSFVREGNRVSRVCALHVLEMFDVDPFFARTEFGPEIWEGLFMPHVDSIVGWYLEERERAGKGRGLDLEYGKELDRCTRVYARYYKEVVGRGVEGKGMLALPPIAEAKMTPQREVRREIPDFVKFGPLLPKSAGFAFGGEFEG